MPNGHEATQRVGADIDVFSLLVWKERHEEKHVSIEKRIDEFEDAMQLMIQNNQFIKGLQRVLWALLIPFVLAIGGGGWALLTNQVSIVFNK